MRTASGLGKRRIEQLVAERFPRPEVHTSLYRQPVSAGNGGAITYG